jgi:hypothetical protein
MPSQQSTSQIFSAALGLQIPWYVATTQLDHPAGQLHLTLDFTLLMESFAVFAMFIWL